jgi:hypothetical protein
MATKTFQLKASQVEVDRKTGKVHLKVPEGFVLPKNLATTLANARPTIKGSFTITW